MTTRAGWAIGLAAGLSMLASACTFIIDKSSDQCSTPEDCLKFPGTTCVENVCQPATIAGSCNTTTECIAALGDYHICRKSDRTCRPLLSDLCTTVEGDYTNDNAFIIGSVLPVTGDPSTGVPEENGIKLAINDFRTAANGLPPPPGSASRRPIVLVGCTDNADQTTAVQAATHLVDVVGVPAIIGAAYSGITIRMATDVTIPKNVLVISPSATSTALTDLADNGLLWRTSPSDVFQSKALARFIEQRLQPKVKADLMLSRSDKIKLTVLHKGDAYGRGLAESLEGDPGNLKLNGVEVTDPSNADVYQRVDYGDPDDPMMNPPKYQDAIEAALAEKPHIIGIFGTNEAVTQIMAPIEANWDLSGPQVLHRPVYLFADGGYIDELYTVIDNEDWRKRVMGSVPGTTNPIFNAFKNNYNAKFKDSAGGPDTFGSAGAYDAMFMLAYAATVNEGKPETGPNLRDAFARIFVDGSEVVEAGLSDISAAFKKLAAGGDIDFNGASGPLAFDLGTGEAPSDVQIWCVTTTSTGKLTRGFSGIYLDAAAGSLSGPSWFDSFCKP